MTPATVADMIAKYGRALTLRRYSSAMVATDVAVKGVVRGYAADEMVGAIQQGDREVRISNAEIAAAAWPGPPRAGENADRIVIDGQERIVMAVDPRYIGADPALYIMQVRG